MARKISNRLETVTGPQTGCPLTWPFTLERVTRIELALSAWESDRSGPLTALSWAVDAPLVTVIDRATPGLMARQWPAAPRSWALAKLYIWDSDGHRVHIRCYDFLWAAWTGSERNPGG